MYVEFAASEPNNCQHFLLCLKAGSHNDAKPYVMSCCVYTSIYEQYTHNTQVQKPQTDIPIPISYIYHRPSLL